MATFILALEKDLFFSVKIRDTLHHHGMEAITVRTLASFEQRLSNKEEIPALVIVNTAIQGVDWEAAIRAAHDYSIPVLAFGPHTDLEIRSKALRAGAQKVVANSKFSSGMVGLVKRMTGNIGSTDASSETEDEVEEDLELVEGREKA